MGETTNCLIRFKFPGTFSLSYNETHYSNEEQVCNFIEEILQPYVSNIIKREILPVISCNSVCNQRSSDTIVVKFL